MTMTLAGCSTEDTMSGDSMSKTLTISVKDGGFDGQNSKASKVTSRAKPTGDDGLGTDFTMNDQIGIFEVKDGKLTKSNVCYINDGSLWNASNTIQYDANATYFAYYPYISDDAFKTLTGATDMSSAVDATAATDASLTTDQAKAEKFFATLIDKWTPKTDQTKMEDYNASDLMVAKGTLPTDADGYTMSFTMNHEMGLCLTTLSPVTYRVDKTYSFVMWPDYKLSGDDKTTSPNSGWFLPVGAQLYAILNQLNIAGGGTDINLESQEKETFITSVTATGVQASLKKAFENLGEGYYQFVTNSNKYCFTTASWAKAGSNYGFSFKIDTNQLMGSTTYSDPIGYFPILAF